jgi:prophage regulatory protein
MFMEASVQNRFLSPKAVCDKISLSRSTLDRLVSAGQFPAPIRLTQSRLAFAETAVEAWMQEKVAA